jgi:hypothetical protein
MRGLLRDRFQYNYPLLGTEPGLITAAVQKHVTESSAWVSENPLGGTAAHREVAAAYLSRRDVNNSLSQTSAAREHYTFTTILPICWFDSMYRCACTI